MTEEEILRSIRAGGRSAEAGLKALYRESAAAMLRFFVYRGLSGDEAKDVLQETIIRVVRGAASYSAQGAAKSWIWQIARNCLSDHLRKRNRLGQHEAVFDEDGWQRLGEVSAGTSPCSTDATLEDCVAEGVTIFRGKMPDRAYVLTLQMEGASVDEIAGLIGRTAAATRQYLSQCRQKLQPFIAHCRDYLSVEPA